MQTLAVDGLRRGLHECAKALAKASKGADGSLVVAQGGARLCILAKDCDEPAIPKLVKVCERSSV
jgi:ribosomal protein L7Ae-like RNA K-turn-binding protein